MELSTEQVALNRLGAENIMWGYIINMQYEFIEEYLAYARLHQCQGMSIRWTVAWWCGSGAQLTLANHDREPAAPNNASKLCSVMLDEYWT